MLRTGEIDVTRLAEQEGVTPSYLTRVVRLAFLSPRVVQAVILGTLRADIDGASLTTADAIAGPWSAQEARLLPG